MARLELLGIRHAYASRTVLDDVSLAVDEGEFLVLLGPSGCGKSTLLRIVAGLVRQSAGEVRIDGERADELEPRERGVAMVFQNYALYPHKSVRGNLSFPLENARLPRAEIERRVARAAARLGLEGLLEHAPGALSGGQMQRVALGRALVREPRLFLFDEPLSNLDARLRVELRGEIARLTRELGVTTLYVTHDQAEAMTLGTRVCVMDAGRVAQLGTPLELYRAPASRFVASFVGHPPMNLVPGRVGGGRFRRGALELAAPLAEGELVLGFRPHEVVLGRGVPLPVTRVERLGNETHVVLDLAGASVCAVLPGDAPVRETTLALELPPAGCHWFRADTGARLAP